MPQEEIVLVCERCHGSLEKVHEGLYKCKMCGSIKELQTTTSVEIKALINNANQLRKNGDFDEAYDIYQEIVSKDPNNPEGYWGSFLSEYGIQHEKDPKTKRYMPTCHRISKVSVFENANLKKALELGTPSQQEDLKQQAQEIEDIRAKIVKISDNEPPYDVFICYKRTAGIDDSGEEFLTKDANSARMIYDTLTAQGYRVFFAEMTLRNLAGNDYEPIIFNALNTSKVMIVVCSRPDYINSTWVKNEWRRFLKLMEFDDSKKIIPVCQNMSPANLPDLLKKTQAIEITPKFESELLANVGRIINLASRVNMQRVSFDQKKVTKKSKVVKTSIEARTIKAKATTDLVVSEQIKLRNAWIALSKENYDSAISDFYSLQTSNQLSTLSDFILSYIRFVLNGSGISPKLLGNTYADLKNPQLKKVLQKTKNYSFEKRGSKGKVSNEFYKPYTDDLIEKFNAIVENTDQETLDIVFDKMKGLLFKVPSNELKSTLYYAIASWESKIKNEIFEYTFGLVSEHPYTETKVLYDTIVKCYDANDVDGYIALLDDFASIYMKNYSFKFAIDAYNKILEVDEGNVKARWNRFFAEIEIPNIAMLKFVTYKLDDKTIEKLKEDVLSYCTDAGRKNYLDMIVSSVETAFDFLRGDYQYKNRDFIEYALMLFGYKKRNCITQLTSTLAKLGSFKDIKKTVAALEKSRQTDPNKNSSNKNLYKFAEVNNLLSIFDKVNTFYPESYEDHVISNIKKMAEFLLKTKRFEKAEQYYNQLLSQNNKDTEVYWCLLKCKTKSRDDEALTFLKTPLDEYEDFNNAVNSVPESDTKKVEYYYDILDQQRANISGHVKRRIDRSENKNKTQKKVKNAVDTGRSIKFILFSIVGLAVLALIGGILAYNFSPSFLATKVSNATEFQTMVTKGKGKYFLTSDIDLSTLDNYTNDTSRKNHDFSGKVYGDGHTIKYANNTTNNKNTAIFRYLYKAKIQDLVIDVDLSSSSTEEFYAGLSTKAFSSTIKNVTVKGEIQVNNIGIVGGIAGYAENCTIDSCTTEANITAKYYVGGIAGIMRGSKIKNCTNKGNVTAVGVTTIAQKYSNLGVEGIDDSYNVAGVGGIVGYARNNIYIGELYDYPAVWTKLNKKYKKSSITGCVNTGTITGNSESEYVGGILGLTVYDKSNTGVKYKKYYAATVDACKNSGTVSGDNYIGGIVGGTNGSVTNCENSGAVSGDWFVSGVVGKATNVYKGIKITDNTNTGKITGRENLGGVIGGLTSDIYDCKIENLTNKGEIALDNSLSGKFQDIGGVIGWMNYSSDETIQGLHNYGKLSIGTASAQRIGGIVGNIEGIHKLNLRNCTNNTSISAANSTNVGGIVGSISSGNYSDGTGVYFSGLKQIGNVTGNDYVGGCFGYVSASYIDNSTGRFTLTGTVTGSHKGSFKGNY